MSSCRIEFCVVESSQSEFTLRLVKILHPHRRSVRQRPLRDGTDDSLLRGSAIEPDYRCHARGGAAAEH